MNKNRKTMNGKGNFQLSIFNFPFIIVAMAILFSACNNNKISYDASGAFEAEEIFVSSEASGIIKQLNIEEGQTLEINQTVGYIDSVQIYLKKKQLEAQIQALLGKKPNISVQLSALQEQLKTAEKERIRIANLVKGDAATPKQLDDINAQIEVLKKQIEAQKSSLNILSTGISQDVVPLQVQIEQLNDQLHKCRIVNPVKGMVLTKYAEANEVTITGKPLYKIANIDTLNLRAYITGTQLPQVKIGQQVNVRIDSGKDDYKTYQGTIIWISDKAEFSPKTIQTKDERANLVYAIKVSVKNDGYLKIGMYGEVLFN